MSTFAEFSDDFFADFYADFFADFYVNVFVDFFAEFFVDFVADFYVDFFVDIFADFYVDFLAHLFFPRIKASKDEPWMSLRNFLRTFTLEYVSKWFVIKLKYVRRRCTWRERTTKQLDRVWKRTSVG